MSAQLYGIHITNKMYHSDISMLDQQLQYDLHTMHNIYDPPAENCPMCTIIHLFTLFCLSHLLCNMQLYTLCKLYACGSHAILSCASTKSCLVINWLVIKSQILCVQISLIYSCWAGLEDELVHNKVTWCNHEILSCKNCG